MSYFPTSLHLSGNYEKLAADADQLAAAKAIVCNPLTVISGRGGTGKTQVVTSVMEAVERYYEEEAEYDVEEDDDVYDDSDSDEYGDGTAEEEEVTSKVEASCCSSNLELYCFTF